MRCRFRAWHSRSSTTMSRSLDCSARPAVPRRGCRAAMVASREMLVLATPDEPGPISRMPWRRQMPSSSARAAPSSPEVTTARARTPRRPHSPAIAGTASPGTAMTARSTWSGSAATDGRQGVPSRSARPGLTT